MRTGESMSRNSVKKSQADRAKNTSLMCRAVEMKRVGTDGPK